METKIYKINRDDLEGDEAEEIFSLAASFYKKGDLVAFPTETVYGLGADGLNPSACKKIFEAKERPADNPLILHISDFKMTEGLITGVSQDAKKLAENLRPGPLTMIFKKTTKIDDIVTGGGSTVAIRFPKDRVANRLIAHANTPIAAPSANISGRPSPTNAADVYFDMKGKIPMIIDGGESDIGIESTVIDMTEKDPIILRPGFYTYEYLREFVPNIRLDDSLVDDSKIPRSPGQKYKHYAPRAEMRIFVGEKAPKEILRLAKESQKKGLKVGIMDFSDTREAFTDFDFISLGDRENLIEMSHVLFTGLRILDSRGVDLILAEGVREENLGKSIMNRMKKSAAGKVFYIN